MGIDCPRTVHEPASGTHLAPPEAPPGLDERQLGDPSRAGARWIGATGVALLLAAAAVLTAVRWDDIGQTAKLSGLVAITLALLIGGRKLRTLIPTTAQTLFHLGALLVPFDMAAVSTLAGQPWQLTLLTTSVTSAVVWYAILTIEDSVVLSWAARGGLAFAAAGVAAVAPVAAPLLLAPMALVAVLAGRVHAGLTWSLIAGLAPLTAFVPWPSRIAGAADDLGLVVADRWQLVAAGVISVIAAALVSRAQPTIELAWTTLALATATVVTALAGGGAVEPVHLGIAVGFVGLELAALAIRSDADWHTVLKVPLMLTETVAGLATIALVSEATMAPVGSPLAGTIGVIASLHLLGWLVADRRRLLDPTDWLVGSLFGADWPVTTFAAPFALFAAVTALTESSVALAIAGLGLAAWWLASRRTFGEIVAIAAVWVAIWDVESGATGLAIVIAGAVVLNLGARARRDDAERTTPAALVAAASLVWVAALIPLETMVGWSWALAAVAPGAWAMGWMLDRSWHTVGLDLSSAWRGLAVMVALLAFEIGELASVVMFVGLAAMAAIDTHRSGRVALSAITGGLAAGAMVAVVPLANVTGATAGLFLATMGLAATALAFAQPGRVDAMAAAAAAVFAVAGIELASTDQTSLALVLIIGSAAVAVIALARRDALVAGGAALLAHAGVWMLLADQGVEWTEAYLLLPSLVALGIGSHFVRRGVSSWLTHAPVFALFGLVSLGDRLTGGSAWHAVIAGAVGVSAVIIGGVARLIGPLITGTAILAIVVGYESLGSASLVPTWAWLATGGIVLLGAAVVLERTDTTPIERGQQLRRALQAGFS